MMPLLGMADVKVCKWRKCMSKWNGFGLFWYIFFKILRPVWLMTPPWRGSQEAAFGNKIVQMVKNTFYINIIITIWTLKYHTNLASWYTMLQPVPCIPDNCLCFRMQLFFCVPKIFNVLSCPYKLNLDWKNN